VRRWRANARCPLLSESLHMKFAQPLAPRLADAAREKNPSRRVKRPRGGPRLTLEDARIPSDEALSSNPILDLPAAPEDEAVCIQEIACGAGWECEVILRQSVGSPLTATDEQHQTVRPGLGWRGSSARRPPAVPGHIARAAALGPARRWFALANRRSVFHDRAHRVPGSTAYSGTLNVLVGRVLVSQWLVFRDGWLSLTLRTPSPSLFK